MKIGRLMSAALAVSLFPAVALADDPRDPSMRNPAARARDSALTRQLNLSELSRVRAREARGELGWHYASDTSGARSSERASTDYARDRAQYERDMAAWRRSVAACRNGDYSACDN